MGGEAVEGGGPESLVATKPLGGSSQRCRRQAHVDGASVLRAPDQAGVAEDVEVLHHRGQRDREGLGQGAYGQAVLLCEPREDRAARRVRERGEDAFEVAGSIVYQSV